MLGLTAQSEERRLGKSKTHVREVNLWEVTSDEEGSRGGGAMDFGQYQ